MTIGAKPTAEVTIDAPTIRALLREQHPDLAHLPLIEVGEGWDNVLFRLGDDLVVRMPRRAASAALIENEQRWLPRLAPRLPLPVPIARRMGRPGCGFPWAWSVLPWLPGHSALVAPPQDLTTTADALGRFVGALHQPAPEDAPRNRWRGVPLAAREQSMQEHLRQVDGMVDRNAVLALWEQLVATPPWTGPPLWIHGDLHPGNLLVCDGRLSAVLDFGDLTAGDPATDLSVMWMLLPRSAQPIFLASSRGAFDAIDSHTLRRARAWALALGLAYLAGSRDDDAMAAMARATIDAAVCADAP